MPLHESQTGDAKRLPVNSALSGKPLDFSAGDVSFKINGWRVGVKAQEWANATPEQKAAAKAEWAANLPKAAPSTPEKPAYDSLSLADLKALAKDRGVDISGKNSKADITNALHFADLQGLNAPPAPVDTAPLDLSGATGE